MADKRAIVAAVGKYNRIFARIEGTRSEIPLPTHFRDLSGSYIDRQLHEKMVAHLRESLVLDDEDDAFRLLLAGQLWRANRMEEALTEYRRIVERDRMQSIVAARMIEEIGKAAS